MTTPRRFAVAVAAASVLTLLMPVSGASAAMPTKNTTFQAVLDSGAYSGSYLPAKNTTYTFVDSEPLFTGSTRIRVGGDKKLLTKVTVKVSCPEGDDKVAFKNLPYRPEFYRFDGVKGPKSKPAYEFHVQFSNTHNGIGSLWLHDGPCAGYLFNFRVQD